MAITFTSWTAGTEGGNAVTLDWGTSADDLEGKIMYRYCSALGQALNERTAFATDQSGYSPATNPITEAVQGLDIYDWAMIFQQYMTTLCEAGFADYTVAGGGWQGQALTEIPTWANANAVIAYLIGKGVLPAGTTRIVPVRGESIREWVWQQYAMLDALRWFATREDEWGFNPTASYKVTGSDPDWATVVSDFNASSFAGNYSVKLANHYAAADDTPEYTVSRYKLTGVSFTGIPTHINHQMVWYRQVEAPGQWFIPPPTYSAYENNDFGAGEDELWIFHTSSVGNPSSHTGITLGDYNSGNVSVSQPTTAPSGYQRYLGWETVDYSNSRNYVLFKLDVAGGLTFVT